MKKRKATFEFVSTEPNSTFECKLNNIGGFEACTSPDRVKGKVGRNTFQVRAVDAAGNADASAAVYTWKVKKKRHRRH